jgi:uncharacterized membrane protein YgcG
MPDPPGEQELRALARRFEDTEARIRALISNAPDGNRRALLTEALEALIALRRQDLAAPVTAAYLAAFRAVRRGGNPQAVRDLSRSLAAKLDDAATTASDNTRAAFRAVTPDNLEELQHDAVTAHVDRVGKRWTLGAYAEMTASTIGRRASSRGTLDGVGPGGSVTVSSHGTNNPVCQPLEGKTFPAGRAPQPPFHANCKHYLIAS